MIPNRAELTSLPRCNANSILMKTKFSWKTSAAGFIAIAGTAISQFKPEWAGLFSQIVAIATGIGLLSARDNNVTSEQAGAK